jgi:hypothetical protein
MLSKVQVNLLKALSEEWFTDENIIIAKVEGGIFIRTIDSWTFMQCEVPEELPKVFKCNAKELYVALLEHGKDFSFSEVEIKEADPDFLNIRVKIENNNLYFKVS